MGLQGKRGQKRCFGLSVRGVSARKISGSRQNVSLLGDFNAIFIWRESSYPDRLAKVFLGSRIIFCWRGWVRWIREPGFARRPAGFLGLSMTASGRNRPDQDWMDSVDD